MFNRKIEARSQSIMTLATQPLITEHHFMTAAPIDQKLLELYNLFSQEEALAAQIAENEPDSAGKVEPKFVDKATIYNVVATARKIAAQGYSTNLIPLDEMLDIAHIYYLDEPAIEPRTVSHWSSQHLVDLQGNLEEENNSAWTARVAAALAYFSA
ncbi:MAG: hypothetical protein WAV56_02535 [Microgenomates group bacterium]